MTSENETSITPENEEEEEEESSVLGTKTFWDQQYETELENFKEFGDIGEIWFGKRMMDLIVNWVVNKMSKDTCSILDLGCGNGLLLIQLAQKGFLKLCGVDYSESAVALAKAIADSRKADIIYKTVDVLSDTERFDEMKQYDLVIDKGTFDAITLMEDFGPLVRERYINATRQLLKDDGLFLIATCNWTQEEIIQHMETSFQHLEVLPTPSLQFGGLHGHNVSVVVFRKK